MASNVSDIISSTDLGGGLIPTQYVTDIIQGAPQSSVLLSRARRVQMSTRTRTQPVLDSLPLAYWVNGDNGLKQTTKMKWTGLNITAEELAVIVAIPDAVIADSSIDLWGEVTPRISAAIGLAFDQAGIFGVNKPSSFPTDIVAGATAANNTVTAGHRPRPRRRHRGHVRDACRGGLHRKRLRIPARSRMEAPPPPRIRRHPHLCAEPQRRPRVRHLRLPRLRGAQTAHGTPRRP